MGQRGILRHLFEGGDENLLNIVYETRKVYLLIEK